ncbi:MAG TPA: PQQ-binding-like beta-propeller repeat protein [Kofleriaceae bacterium]|nr:PQQ-binding-like beta-propeller repeat protein [Kofleriaceae bacterium]
MSPNASMDALSPVRHEVGPPVLGLRWTKIVAKQENDKLPIELATAAVGKRYIYVGSKGGTFYKLDAADGHEVWATPLGATSTQPTLYRGRLYIGTDDGYLVAVDAANGEEQWRYETQGAVLEPAVVSDDAVYFSTQANQVYALDRQSGKFRWQHSAEDPENMTVAGHAGVAVAGDRVITGYANGTLVALSTETGAPLWMTSLAGDDPDAPLVDADATPVIIGDLVVAASVSGGVYGLDLQTGLVRWRIPVKNAGRVAVHGDEIFFTAADIGVFAADLRGHVRWRQGTRGAGVAAPPVWAGGYLIYSLGDTGLFVADPRTGEVLEYFEPGFGISAQAAATANRLYILSNTATLYAFSLRHF